MMPLAVGITLDDQSAGVIKERLSRDTAETIEGFTQSLRKSVVMTFTRSFGLHLTAWCVMTSASLIGLELDANNFDINSHFERPLKSPAVAELVIKKRAGDRSTN